MRFGFGYGLEAVKTGLRLFLTQIQGYMADFDKNRGDSVFYDNYNRIMEINNLQEGLVQTQYHGLKASVLDGSSQYWQLALPNDRAVFDLTALSHGSTSLPTGWTKQAPATTTVRTDVMGSAKCVEVLFGSNAGIYQAGILTIGKKYKVSFRYKANYFFRIGSLTAAYRQPSATAEWNSITFVFTADSTDFYIRGEGAYYAWIESLTIKEDQGLDANEDKERILHSKNAESERTLGAELSSGTVTIGKRYVVTLGTVEGNVLGAEFLATTNATTLDSNNKVKEIPNLFTNGNLADGTNWLREEPATQTFADGVCHFVNTTLNYSIYADAVNRKLINGRRYRLSLQILNYVSGGLRTGGTGVPVSPGFTANGVHTFDFTYTGSNGALYISAFAAGTTLDFDNIHCYEIPEWTPSQLTAGNNHYCDISTLDKAAGTQSQRIVASGAGRSAELLANGTFTDATGWGLEVGTPTWTISGGTLNGNGVSGAKAAYNTTLTGLSSGDTVEVTGTITNRTVGYFNIKVGYGVGGTVQQVSANGGFVARVVVGASGTTIIYFDGYGFDGSIDNVSVKKYFGEITLPTANIEPLVAGKKYTLEGKARLDPASLVYGSDLFTSISHSATYAYETLTVSGNDIISAINTTGFADAYINIGNVTANEIVKVTFNLTLNSGTAPRVLLMQTGELLAGTNSDTVIPVIGANTLYFRVVSTQSPNYLVIREPVGTATNFSISDIVITKSTTIAATITHQIGTKSVNAGGLSIVPGSFTKFVMNFEATASEVYADWKSYLSGVGAVFVDGLSLTQSFDGVAIFKAKDVLETSFGGLLGVGGLPPNNVGMGANIHSGNFRPAITDNTNVTIENSTGTDIGNNFNVLTSVLDRTGNLSKYINGTVLGSGQSITSIGKVIKNGATHIGSLLGSSYKFGGLISTVQIIRFDNISKTNFNPNTYQPGDAITDNGGGVPEVVLWQDWTNIIGAIAMDKYRPETTRRNDLTAYGSPLASTNIVTVKDFSPQTKKLRQSSISLQPTFNSVSGFVFNGTNNILIASQNFGDTKTIILKIKVDTLESEQDLLQLNDSTVLTLNTDGSITATGFFEETIKIQTTLLADALVTTDQEYLVCVKSGGGISTDSFKLGGSSTYLKGNIKKVTLFSTELDDATIQKIFKSIRSI